MSQHLRLKSLLKYSLLAPGAGSTSKEERNNLTQCVHNEQQLSMVSVFFAHMRQNRCPLQDSCLISVFVTRPCKAANRFYPVVSSVQNKNLKLGHFEFKLLSRHTLSLCSIIVLLVSSKQLIHQSCNNQSHLCGKWLE